MMCFQIYIATIVLTYFPYVFVFQITTSILLGFLVFEDLPLTLIVTCLASNVAYYFVMETFPYTQLASPSLLLSGGQYRIKIQLTFYLSVNNHIVI